MLINALNSFVFKYIKFIEMLGVLMRIFSFSLVSWLGPESPFMFVWVFNTIDAVILSWCSMLKKDSAYTLLNVFWIMVGVIGMFRASRISVLDLKSAGEQFLTQVVALFT